MGREFGTDRSGEENGRSVRAAQYARMSTEHQKYSTENQAEAMQQYAARRGIEIVRTYADAGKSGLSLDGRDGLKKLIEDVQNKTADFTTILVAPQDCAVPPLDFSGHQINAPHHAAQHHHSCSTTEMPTQSGRERLTIYARQLALGSHLQNL